MRPVTAFLILLGVAGCADEASEVISEDGVGSYGRHDETSRQEDVRSRLSFGPLRSDKLVTAIDLADSPLLPNNGGTRGIAYGVVIGGDSFNIRAKLDRGTATFESGFAQLTMKHQAQLWRATSGVLEFDANGDTGTIRLRDVKLSSNSESESAVLGPLSGAVTGAIESRCPEGEPPSGLEVQSSRVLADGGLERCP